MGERGQGTDPGDGDPFMLEKCCCIRIENDRALDSQATLFALEEIAPQAKLLHLDSGREALEYLFAT
jgi:hypothetical protein